MSDYGVQLGKINQDIKITQAKVDKGETDITLFTERKNATSDTVAFSDQALTDANANAEIAKQSTKSLENAIDTLNTKLDAYKIKFDTAPDDQKAAVKEQIDNIEKQIEEQQKKLDEAKNNENSTIDKQQKAEVSAKNALVAAQEANTNLKATETQQKENKSQLENLTGEMNDLEALIENEQKSELKNESKFDTAMSNAANNIQNADGNFDKQLDGKSSHLEQSLALANQSKEDRAVIQKELTKEFDSTDHNFDKDAGKSATHGYAVEARDLADLNEVTGMFDGTSAENVAKMYQCAVPLNGDDVFKMEADTASELLKEANSAKGFSDENKAKILNALDNGFQGETPVTHTKYDRQAVDVLTDNYTTQLSQSEIDEQINTIKAKVSGENTEPLTEKEFRAITYLYDIEAGGEKIGITNWDGSLGVQEGQKFNKRMAETMIKEDVYPVQGEGEGAPVDAVAVKNIYASRQDQMPGSSHVLTGIPEASIISTNSAKCRTREPNAVAASSLGYEGKFINQVPIKSENSSQTTKYSGYFLHNQPEEKLSDFEKSLVQSMRDEASSSPDGKCKTYYMIVTHSRENIGNGFKDRGIEYGGNYDQCLIAFTVSDDGKTWTKTTPEIYDDYMKKIKK